MISSQWEAPRQLDITQTGPNRLTDIQTLQIPFTWGGLTLEQALTSPLTPFAKGVES